MAQPLRIYTFVPQQSHASYYYRVLVPMETADKLGLPVTTLVDSNIEGVAPEDRIRHFCEADVVLLYQPIGDGSLTNMKMAKAFLPSKRDGAWKYPPTMIVDTDDNLFRVDPLNGAFRGLGCCDPDTGKPIPKGHSIAHVENGVRKVLWKDGQDGFDVTRNRATIETYREIVNHADCLTCTTPRLAGHMEAEASPRQVRVAPNLMRFDHYPQIDLQPTPRVRILWQGGANHQLDWNPLREAVGRVAQKYRNEAEWVMWGVQYPWAMELIPPERLTFLPWAPYHEYKLRRVMIGDDINLAPLNNNLFNDSRSAIKFYEASVQKRPSATLAQRTGPYADEIIDGETGLLFETADEFEDKLSRLIEDRAERKRLGKNAKDWLTDNRNAMKEVPKLIQFYQHLRDEAPYDQPHMPEKAWERFEAQMQAQAAAEAQKQQEAVAA